MGVWNDKWEANGATYIGRCMFEIGTKQNPQVTGNPGSFVSSVGDRRPYPQITADLYIEPIFKEGVLYDLDWFKNNAQDVAYLLQHHLTYGTKDFGLWYSGHSTITNDVSYGSIYWLLEERVQHNDAMVVQPTLPDLRAVFRPVPHTDNPLRITSADYAGRIDYSHDTFGNRYFYLRANLATYKSSDKSFKRYRIGDYLEFESPKEKYIGYYYPGDAGIQINTSLIDYESALRIDSNDYITMTEGDNYHLHDFGPINGLYGYMEGLGDIPTSVMYFRSEFSPHRRNWYRNIPRYDNFFYKGSTKKSKNSSIPVMPTFRDLNITEINSKNNSNIPDDPRISFEPGFIQPIILYIGKNEDAASLFVQPVGGVDDATGCDHYIDNCKADVVVYIDQFRPDKKYYISLIHYLIRESKKNMMVTTTIRNTKINLRVFVREEGNFGNSHVDWIEVFIDRNEPIEHPSRDMPLSYAISDDDYLGLEPSKYDNSRLNIYYCVATSKWIEDERFVEDFRVQKSDFRDLSPNPMLVFGSNYIEGGMYINSNPSNHRMSIGFIPLVWNHIDMIQPSSVSLNPKIKEIPGPLPPS